MRNGGAWSVNMGGGVDLDMLVKSVALGADGGKVGWGWRFLGNLFW